MSKVMLVNVSHEEESRVAVVEGGVLESLEIETISRSLKGNIYKAVVQNVNAGLEAAFIDYGDERAGFLPLDEVNFKVLPTLPGRDPHRRGRITDHLTHGIEILVQVVRDAFSTKPPTFSTFYSLPGRYLVLTPKSDGQGISRKIEDLAQRDRLKKIVEELNPPDGYGVIVRTAGMGQSKTELQRDLRYLLRLWESIETAAAAHRAPSLIYQERDIVLRTIRDHFTPDIEEVLIDDEEVCRKARRFVQAVMPQKEKAFKLYTGDKPLFSKYNLEDQIESIFRREVPLKAGGAIVIDTTEALTAIDVNSARSVREGNIEETALKTNLEAADEAARQLRLRDLGGLIVVDFIDMYQDKHVRAVEKTIKDALRKDKAKCDVTRISKFGLMEISRQRLKVAKASAAYTPCGHCDGTGIIKTTEAAALSVLRRIQARVVKGDLAALKATLPEDVAVYLLNQKREELVALERRYGTRISIIPHASMNRNRGEIDTVVREEGEAAPPPRPLVSDEITRGLVEHFGPAGAAAPVVTTEDAAEAMIASEEAAPPAIVPGSSEQAEVSTIETSPAEHPSSAGKKRRRRRRRSGRGEGASVVDSASLTQEAASGPLESRELPKPGRPLFEEAVVGAVEQAPEVAFVDSGQGDHEEPAPDAPFHTTVVNSSEARGSEEGDERLPAGTGEAETLTGVAATGASVVPVDGAQLGEQRPANRRRRRRRRRSRRGGAPGDTARATQTSPTPVDDGSEPAPRGGSRPVRGDEEAVPYAPSGAVTTSATGTARESPSSPSAPKPDEAGEEEIPGGWWQKLTGGSKRSRSGGED